jgi:glutathione S-transferase
MRGKPQRQRRFFADTEHQIQPPVMPRPDLEAIGVNYRRIPVMGIGRDVYCDTRLMLDKLEQLFPSDSLGASQPDQKAVQKLLEKWTIDAGVFARASQLIPTSMPLLNDPKFTKDREDFSGRSWNKAQIEAMRPESIAHIREGFSFLERTLLADDREWILKTKKPSLADIEGKAHLHCIRSITC